MNPADKSADAAKPKAPPEAPVPPIIGLKPAVTPEPTFFRALRGIWLFTWRSHLTLRRLPMKLLGLLILPALVYMTTSPAIWIGHQSRFNDPRSQFRNFSRDLSRARVALSRAQEQQLRQIFDEEFGRAQQQWESAVNRDPNTTNDSGLMKSCWENIRTRAREVLGDRQFNQFESFGNGYVRDRMDRPAERRTRGAAFYVLLIRFYFLVILPLHCVRLSGALIRDELQADTISFLLTRPLTRAQLVIAKFLSQTAWLQIVLLAQTLLMFAAAFIRQVPGAGGLLPLFVGTQILAVLTWSALGLLGGMIAKGYMLIALLYGLIIEVGIGMIPTNINTLSMTTHLKSLLSRNDVLQSLFDFTSRTVPVSIGALLIATTLFVALSAAIFTFREYHHTSEMQK